MAKIFFIDVPLLVFGGLLSTCAGAWRHIGYGMMLASAVLALSRLRVVVQAMLRRSGRRIDIVSDGDRVRIHLCALLMGVFAATQTFGSDVPREYGIRWQLTIGLPLSVYAFDGLWRLMVRLLGPSAPRKKDR
jgi:hypothetical protein